jgi:hypothetical protein
MMGGIAMPTPKKRLLESVRPGDLTMVMSRTVRMTEMKREMANTKFLDDLKQMKIDSK